MNTQVKRWLPIALCCVPGLAIAAVVGISIAVGGAAFGASFGGPLGLGLIVLALLACPLSMSLMMWRARNRTSASGNSAMMADCCVPGKQASTTESDEPDRLKMLRAQREALEREVAELQAR